MAESFYEFTRIKVNPSKSTLATTNQEPNNKVNYNNKQIKPINKKEPFKILGCWFTINKLHKEVYKQIIKEAITAINCLKKS